SAITPCSSARGPTPTAICRSKSGRSSQGCSSRSSACGIGRGRPSPWTSLRAFLFLLSSRRKSLIVLPLVGSNAICAGEIGGPGGRVSHVEIGAPDVEPDACGQDERAREADVHLAERVD